MLLRYNFRIYPTPAQRQALAKAFGCARVVYNDGLRLRQQTHAACLPYPSDGDLSKKVITLAKATPERAWLREVSAVVLQQALADLSAAFRSYFASEAGRRGGPRVGSPRYRSKKDKHQSIRFTLNSGFHVLANERLRLPKVGDIAVRWSRALPSAPTSVTVVHDAAGRYFASFVVTARSAPMPEADAEVGIDLGLGHFAVLSDGTKITAPKLFRRAERKLRRLQKAVTRKVPGSKNRIEAGTRLARMHAKIGDARRDWHHKLSTTLVRDNQAVYVEDLCVAGLARTRLAKSIADAGWSQFVQMLDYKASLAGRRFGRIDRFAPTSRKCSTCGRVGDRKPLHVREWTCLCGAVHDRDINAAQNVLAQGRWDNSNACGAQIRPAEVSAPRDEAGIRSGVGRLALSTERIAAD